MAFHLTLEQVSFASEGCSLVSSSSLDSLNSVVDANIDFKATSAKVTDPQSDQTAEKWKFDMDLPTKEKDLIQISVLPDVQAADRTERNNNEENLNISFNEANTAFSYDSIATTYPKIPLQVAQFMNENNPDWSAEAEKYLKLAEVPDLIQNQYCRHLGYYSTDKLLSPLKSMAASSDALALQQSVIGNPCTVPASADVVAQVVKDTRQKFQTQDIRNSDSQHSSSGSFSSPSNAIDSCCKLNMSSSGIMRYPNSSLQSIEKKSWFTNFNDSTPDVPKMPMSSISLKNLDSRRSSGSSVSSQTSSKKNVRSSENRIPIVHSTRNLKLKVPKESYNSHVNHIFSSMFTNANLEWENESCFSEKLEIGSVCSETFETESNFSEVSGIDEEMCQVKKFLAEDGSNSVEPSLNSKTFNGEIEGSASILASKMALSNYRPKVKDQATETEFTEIFDLMRAKANLEGRLESVSQNEVDLTKGRTVLQAAVASLQAKLKALTKQSNLVITEKQSLQKELDMQKMQQHKWDNIRKEYQNNIEVKDSELQALKEDLSEAEQGNIQARISFEELKVDMESKEGAIVGLKKKITEQHVESQSLLQAKIQLENEVKSIHHEINSLGKSRLWYQDQLRSSQENCNRLHQELTTVKANQVSLQNAVERSKTEISSLMHQLKESQNRAITEKEMLMKHLETVVDDMKERDSLFEEIQKDKGCAEDALMDRAKRVEEERTEITKLTYTISDLDCQLNSMKSDVKEKDNIMMCLEKEKADLYKQLVLLQKSMNERELTNQHLSQELKDSLAKMRHMEITLRDSEDLMSKLKEEKTASDVALASANSEKRIINESLTTFKENLNRVESDFKHMRVKLIAKTSQVEQLSKEKCALEDTLKKLEDNMLNQQKTFKLEIINQTQNRDVIVDDLKKQKSQLEHVISVFGEDVRKYQKEVRSLENERNDLKDEMIKLKVLNQSTEERLESLNTENVVLKEQISGLELQLKDDFNNSDSISHSVRSSSTELVAHQLKQNYKKIVRLLLRKLKEKKKQIADLEDKLTEASNTLPSQSLNDLGDELSNEMSKRALLEEELAQVLDTLQQGRNQIQKNQDLIIELEKDKGKTSAISDCNNALKATIAEMESSLSSKDELTAQLNCQLKDLEFKLSESIISYDRRIGNMEEDLNKERTVIKGLRQQVFQEKRSNSYLQRQLTSLKSGLELANQTADSRKQEIMNLQVEIERQLQLEGSYKSEYERMQTVICNKQGEIDKLKKEKEEVSARDPALANQIKLLSWRLKEKNNEISALQGKQILIEERHQVEISALKKSTQNLQIDIRTYKSQLNYMRQEKIKYQTKLMELRKLFKVPTENIMSPHKMANNGEGAGKGDIINVYFPETQSTLDESYINKLLEKSFPIPDNRPLNQLQDCLHSLKLEMAELQKQIHNTAEIPTKEFE